MKRIPRTIRAIIVAYLGLLVVALLWVPWARESSTTRVADMGYSVDIPAASGYRFILSAVGHIQYGQIGLEISVLTVIAGLTCFVVTLLGKRRVQS